MLFSNADIASFITDNFEPAWRSVRAVPIVHIQFDEGSSIKRTLHGNIATSICDAEGRVLDILPGAYAPATYLEQLRHLRTTSELVMRSRRPLEQLHEYHARELWRLDEERLAQARGKKTIADYSKRVVIERPVEVSLRGANKRPRQSNLSAAQNSQRDLIADDLERDTVHNEAVRRRAIHGRLAESAWCTPDDLTNWLYRDVLGTDLEDPHLGLMDPLANYPFDNQE